MSRLPTHRNPTQQDRKAVAPYNFVPLPETVVGPEGELPDHDRYHDGRRTGHFDVTLTTRSPLYVRCPFRLEQFLQQERGEDANAPFRQQVKNTPKFFHTGDPEKPVVPGSSLRGMLRGLLEVVSYAKMQWVTDQQLFFRTVDRTAVGKHYNRRMVSGSGTPTNGYRSLVEGGIWRISPHGPCRIEARDTARIEMRLVATAFGLPNPSSLYLGAGPNAYPNWAYQHRTVWALVDPGEANHPHSKGNFLRYRKATSLSLVAAPGHLKATLVLTGPMQNKHMAFLFLDPPSPAFLNVPNDGLVDRFHDEDQVTRWQGIAFPQGQPAGANRPRDGHLCDGEPVFFLRESGQLTFFGRAQMFRLPYRNRPFDLVPGPLHQAEQVDYAEALFGFVRTRNDLEELRGRGVPIPEQGSKGRAYAGRLSFSDATLLPGETDLWLAPGPLVPKILATPKPTAFQHYLTQQEPNDSRDLDHYDSPPPHETVIRGHKLYWHQGTRQAGQLQETDPQWLGQGGVVRPDSTQHTQFRPLKANKRFKFRIYFENLSDAELGALCWALHPLGEPTKDYCHSLGMGKPLGMGAVKLDAILHLTNRGDRYRSLFDGDNWATGISGTPEVLSDRGALKRLTLPFEAHLLSILRPTPACEHLSGLLRIAMLLKMLEWPGPSGNRYMTIQPQNEYRYRPVLPDPSSFGGLNGSAVPQAPEPSPPGGGGPQHSPKPPAPVQQGKPGKRPHGAPAKVKIIAERGQGAFAVQEEGKSPGVLNQGTPPSKLPVPGTVLDVFVFNDDTRSPQYRWDAPPPPPQRGGGRGGPPNRGRR